MNSKRLLYSEEIDFLGWHNRYVYLESYCVVVLDLDINIKNHAQVFRINKDLVQGMRMWPR